jgi:hypothetical protein
MRLHLLSSETNSFLHRLNISKVTTRVCLVVQIKKIEHDNLLYEIALKI